MGRRSRGAGRPPESVLPAARDGEPDLLEVSPFEGDLDAELAARPASRLKPGVTVYLGAGVLLVAGFVGGVQADRQWGTHKTVSPFAAVAGRVGGTGATGGFGGRAGAAGAAGAAGSGAAAGSATVGTIKLVDGDKVYIQTASGDTIIVSTDSGTKVTIAKAGSLKLLKAGQRVVVTGSTGSDGSVTATSISAGGAGASGSGG